MQVKETAKEGLKREYHVVVPANDLDAKTNARLQEVGQKAKIDGFRPGKIPANILKQRYGKSVLGEVIEQAVQDASQKVISEKDLRPALRPDIKITSYDEGKDLEFDMKIEIFPEMPEVDLSKIEVTKPVFEVAESDVKEGLERIAEQHKAHKPKADSAKAAQGDVVRIDFKGMLDGVAFEGGTAQDFKLELGSGQFIPGFEDQLIGVKKGDDVKVDVTFPEQYHNAELAGKPVVFEVKVHEVLTTEKSKLDDELAKNVGFESLDKLKDAIREHIANDYQQFVQNKMKKDLFDALEDKCSFDVPEGMFKAEFDSIWQQLKQAQERGDESVAGRDDKELEKEYKAIALRRVRLGLYLAELGRKENVQITQQELMGAVVERARQFPGQEQQVVAYYQQNPQQLEELRGPIFEDKVVTLVLDKVKTKEKKVTLDELVAMDMDEDEKPKKKTASKKTSDDEAEKKPAAKKAPAKKTAAKK